MLSENLEIFCKLSDKYKQRFTRYLNSANFDDDDRNVVFDDLCAFLMEPNCAKDVARCFPQYLPLLLSRAICTNSSRPSSTDESNSSHRLSSVILGTLINTNPDVLGFALNYFESNPAPFSSEVDDSAVMTKRRRENDLPFVVRKVSTLEIVTASYNILEAAPEHFKHKWNWSEFYDFLAHPDDTVKWITLKCIGIVLGMSESTRLSRARSLIKDPERFLLPEQDRVDADAIAVSSKNHTREMSVSSKNCTSLVSIAGIVLPVLPGSANSRTVNLIAVPSMESNLRRLALAIASQRCVCLQGPVGCGKTALVEYLAEATGHESKNFVKVQLGDQTDSKMLLGNYRCTDVPGEFVWQPGVLTQAVMEGKWLLLEDIDSAALDVASCLSNLIETGTLSVPGYRDAIYVKSGFQLFLTQRTMPTASGFYRRSTGASNILEKHWFCVHVAPLTREELVTVVKSLFPSLATVATRMIDVFLLFSIGNEENPGTEERVTRTGRMTSTRDLVKWCTRAICDFRVSSPDSALKILQDAIDIFCCSVDDESRRLELATAIGHTLGIVKTKAEYFCNIHKPAIDATSDTFQAGRAKLPRKRASYAVVEKSESKFSFTRPSANLLERVASCVARKEPVLLVGETGTGKTSSIQYLARRTGHRLVVINMNQQSESADLLGGYKPVDIKHLVTPTREEFEMLFRSYFATEPNRKFLEHVATCYNQQRWKTLVRLMLHSAEAAVRRLKTAEDRTRGKKRNDEADKNIRGRMDMLARWEKIVVKLEKLKTQVKTHFSLAFAFIEGSLVKALQNGHWVLLDEINLASSETLECLTGLLEGATGSLSLLERGDSQTITRHTDFTIFACMNPATDVGKKELPIGLRNRFTEFYVDELNDRNDLRLLVDSYLGDGNLSTERRESIVKFYLNVRREALTSLNDGTGHKPHNSLRTLCRALGIASLNPCGNLQRSLYEAFCLSFLTQLDNVSYPMVERMITRAILDGKTAKAVLSTPIPRPLSRQGDNENYTNFEGYWIVQGDLEPRAPPNYILTSSVRKNLRDLARVVSIGKIPVLLQGDTSVGKTSLITYLAKSSGHNCLRINNHEHTDLQEYVGNYVADENGKLAFKEGILVEAMRKGHWMILDELNLAPSDVLEALNRVLDDNRELFIPETQQTVKAHENFMLFATQNPPGVYGGRKVLSRAFRNRFVELHFDEIPPDELRTILHERCHMPVSYCKQIISVMTELQTRRKSTAAFQGKHGFITLRDLFRWGERYRLADDVGEGLYDWSQHLADEGYLVLAAKVRRNEEAEEIRQVIKKHLKRDVDPSKLFTLDGETSSVTRSILEDISRGASGFDHVVWTYHMRRMAVLVRKSCRFKEPVLLVGETGGGKTTVCQLIASMMRQSLYSVNCHMHTESSDFLGNLRPVRDHSADVECQKLFEWVDGPLITAMRNGDLFLADEISLADDSVLERLNSLLEPERSLLLAEKSADTADSGESDCVITANEKFQFIGTMNPGGDYGKKELSPALRNRFTEIWCEGCVDRGDLRAIIMHNLSERIREKRLEIAEAILAFVDWLGNSEIGKRFTVSIRDILTWVNFINRCTGGNEVSRLSLAEAYLHGAHLTYIDGLGSGLTGMESEEKLAVFRNEARNFLEARAKEATFESDASEIAEETEDNSRKLFGISPFFIARGAGGLDDGKFTFSAPTTKSNTLKLLRALQLKKPLLLEGSPGVGKTSLVAALAKSSGHDLLRINLSDQTDASDLFGADLPLEGGKSGEFAWKDGPFLRALRAGDWILLDELNLASQSVLEGLNACLDHRGEIYIPELGRTFSVKPATKLFACQNPLRQGGARRGLPKSFLNRFTQVYVDALEDDDLVLIASDQFPEMSGSGVVEKMISFNSILSREAGTSWGHSGSPWEMNLRDIIRWCEIVVAAARGDAVDRDEISYNPGDGVDLVYVDRMRTEEDRRKVREIYQEVFPIEDYPMSSGQPTVRLTEREVHLGDASLPRGERSVGDDRRLLLLRDQLAVLRSLARCVRMNWMPILVGGPGCGKSSVVRVLAQLAGQKLKSVVVNSAMDTTEILGGFEQTDYNRHLEHLLEQVESLLLEHLKLRLNADDLRHIAEYHSWLEKVQNLSHEEHSKITMTAETELFLRRTKELWKLVTAMKSLENAPLDALQSIDEKLRNLATDVKQDKCLNAGGKFEWVDSVLVKCLQEGSWLLLDQVNLCSPAVLDRLNGLLEPGGVLTIGERGVANDGNVLTIKPHKNFRLFLTMDPRYGEISRAMRNRGVEIYMLGHKENCAADILDLRSLLHNLGLRRSNHQEALLEIHEAVSSADDTASEKPSSVHLLHSAFLINQQLSRGFPADEAFRACCADVYVKSRYVQRASSKKRLELVIDGAISRHDVTGVTKNFFDLAALTPKIGDFQENSKLTIVKQQGFLLDALSRIVRSVESPTTSMIDEFFSSPETSETDEDFDLVKISPYLLLSFYEKSSTNDAPLRNRWLRRVFSSNCPDSDASRQLEARSEILASVIEDSRRILASETFNCDLVHSPNVSEDRRYRLGRLNCLALILYLNSMNNQYSKILDDTTLSKNASVISVLRYSSSVYHGKLTSHLKNQPLVTNFVAFVAQVSSCVNLVLRDDSTLLNSEEYAKFRRNVAWIGRFYAQGSLPFVDKTARTARDDFAETSLMLRVHYKWLVKFIKDLFLLGERSRRTEACTREMERLAEMMENIDRSVKTVDDPLRKMTKRIKRHLPMPLPFSSEMTTRGFALMKKLSGELELCAIERGDSRAKGDLKIVLLQKDEIAKSRARLTRAWRDFHKSEHFDESLMRDLREIEEVFERARLALRTPVEISQALEDVPTPGGREIVELSAEVQLWPIYEYMFFILANHLHEKISSDDVEIECRAADALERLSKVPSLPVDVVALFRSIVDREIGTSQRNRLKWQIFTRLDDFTSDSRVFRDPDGILRWRGINVEESSDDSEDRKIVASTSSPVLVNFVSRLITNESRTKEERSILATAPLGAYRSRFGQLKTLNDVLWRNSVALNSADYDKELNDRLTLTSYLRVFLNAEEEMTKERDPVLGLHTEISRQKEATGASELEEKFQTRYVEPLNELKRKAREFSDCSASRDNEDVERAKTWILLGYLQVFLFGNLGHIDPIHKVSLKLGYTDEDIEDCRRTLYVASLAARINGDSFPSVNAHPRVIAMRESLEGLKNARNDLRDCAATRPSCLNFIGLANETLNFRDTLASWPTVERITSKLSRAIEELSNDATDASALSAANDAIQEAETWRESLLRFSKQLDKKFLSGYPDIVVPLQTAVAQLRHGARSLLEETRRRLSYARSRVDRRHTDRLLRNLARFPTIGDGQEDLPSLVAVCTSSETREVINENARNSDLSLVRQFRMVKVGLLELYNHASLEGKLDSSLWREVNALLRQIALIWRKQREESDKMAAERDSLYRNRAKVHGDGTTEDEEIARELRALFPNSRDDDFTDIETSPATLERTETRRSNDEDDSGRYVHLLTDDDVREIHEIHSRIVNFFVEAAWLRKKRADKNERDYVEPLVQRYETLSHLLENLSSVMHYRLSAQLYAGMNFLTFLTVRASDGDSDDLLDPARGKPRDFYRSSNVQEAKQCLTLLETIVDRVDRFLGEWPDHPTLRSIRTIIERIYGFSVTSPISRFLTGLELLLVKMKEWEENAHSGVSLGESSLVLTQQIISWRKLELSCWKDCLNTARSRLASKASKWWFFLYALVESYTTSTRLEIEIPESNEKVEEICKSESVTPEKLLELLEAFIGGSSLVEFQPRLDLLLTFHRHACNSRESEERNRLLAIFWNVHNYYAQFSADVEKRINSIRAPIEKKLRDFVKIARWNDINYWSVKETVAKTHRTLHKFIREYESGLGTSAAVCLLVKPQAYGSEADKGEWDRSKERDYAIDPRDFLCSASAKMAARVDEKMTTKNRYDANDLISRIESLFGRAKRLSRETILMSSYPGLRIGLEEFVENVVSHAVRLKSLEVDRTLPRAKQKSHAKSILQQKKMALADYFKNLSHIGLSYRTGSLAWKNRQSEVIDLTVPPVDLSASLQRFQHGKADRQMLAQWEGCEEYYYKSLIKLNALNVAFAKTRSDLGMPNTERCCGFSCHVMLLAHKQKRIIVDFIGDFTSLRRQVADSSKIDSSSSSRSAIICDDDLHDCARSLKKLLVTLRISLEQLTLYLEACPADPGPDFNEEVLHLERSKLAIVNATKNDAVWQSAASLVQSCLDPLNSIVESHEKLFHDGPAVLAPIHHEFLNAGSKILLDVKRRVRELSRVFSSDEEKSHPILASVEFLERRIDEWTEKFLLLEVVDCSAEDAAASGPDDEASDYAADVELVVKTILLAIQRKYKDTTLYNESAVRETGSKGNIAENVDDENIDREKGGAEVEEDHQMEENSFRERLIESLERDIDGLRLKDVHRLFSNVLKKSNTPDPSLTLQRRALVVRLLPLVEQYLLFSQFYLNEQVGAFRTTCKLLNLQLGVFLDLATNGFCLPKDLDMEEGEGEETKEGKTQNGMGLGDGEGEKDVSDRIESEDQLEDARPADQERDKDEDKDCKEEENGIDMSEDFEGKMQDLEKNDEEEKDNESENENDEELDKQMGETEKGADALDEEIWGDDEDEDANENEDTKEEHEGRGEEIGEKEMTAKEDDSSKRDESDERNESGDKEEREKPEINEINEPEVNDDQIDPYHGNQEPPPEPEPMDLPDDMNLDGEEADDKAQDEEGNPFDIDEMKDCAPPPEKEETAGEEEEQEGPEDKNEADDSTSDEEENEENGAVKTANEDVVENEEPPRTESADDTNVETPETKDDEENEVDKKDEDESSEDKAAPDVNNPSKEMDATDKVDTMTDGTRDKMADQPNVDEQQESTAENNEDESNNRGTGNAHSEQQETGHSGDSMQNTAPMQRRDNDKQVEKRRNPGESDENRTLVDEIQPDRKKMRMIHSRRDSTEENEEEGAEIDKDDNDTEMCQHVKDSERYDDQAVDAATREQVKRQIADKEEEKEQEQEEPMDVEGNLDNEEESKDKEDETVEQTSEAIPQSQKDKEERRKKESKGNQEDGRMESVVEVEGEVAETMRIDRGTESAFFTNVLDDPPLSSSAQIAGKRMQVETMLSKWTCAPSSAEALAAWNCLNSVVEVPARDLAEKLRLVLEPTQATRLKGDYRTGRRINMRKIIPYIASQFRKDKIWLRRTKPSKRDYQIVLAIDDSSSMADNHSKELAFESLSLISKAMSYLEVGEVSVISFGETVNILHPLGQPFTENSGSRLIQEMRFEQKKTKVGQLVDFTVDMFDSRKSSSDSAKLLVVLSDGRGVFSEGSEQVNSAVRRAKLADIFLVFIIVDNPLNKDSILDIRMPVFEAGKLLGIKSYMDSFPFPFYMILRDVNALPGVLSDALRQWFEVVGKIDT